jgi:hypothetical protein
LYHRIDVTFLFSLWQDYGEAIQHLEDANWVLVDAVNRALPGSAAAAAGDDVTVQHPHIHVIDDDDEESNPRPAVSPQPSQFRPPLPPFFMPGDSGGGGGFSGGLPPASFFAAEAAAVAGSSGSGRGARSAAAAGVSMAADFLPMGPSQRSRLLELHIEYRDRMIHLKVIIVCLFYIDLQLGDIARKWSIFMPFKMTKNISFCRRSCVHLKPCGPFLD